MRIDCPTRPRSGRLAGALWGGVVLSASLFSIALPGCSSNDMSSFAKAAGVQDVWVVQSQGQLNKPAFSARPGRVRVTMENHMESATRVSVVPAGSDRPVADFPVGIRQVNWQDVDLEEGDYEVVANRLGDGGTSRSLLRIRRVDHPYEDLAGAPRSESVAAGEPPRTAER